MNEKNLTIEEVQATISEYLDGVRSNFRTSSYGCTIQVGIKYWDFHPERKVRRDIEDIATNIQIVECERMISDEAMFHFMQELFEQESKIFAKSNDNSIRETTLYDFIFSQMINKDVV